MSTSRITEQRKIIREYNFPSGVPINGLPGWENVPLNLKLPMLQTPSNQSRIIFTRAKVGKDLFRKKGEFDARILEEDKIIYNPLHDKHLRKFFSNEAMIRKLQKNDEITENLDVMCSLKEFNQFRRFIHNACLDIKCNRMKQSAMDQKNRGYMNHAIKMALVEEQKPPERSPSGYLFRKEKIFQDKQERNLNNWLKKVDKIHENELYRRYRNAILSRRIELLQKKTEAVLKNAREILRSKEIINKKNLETKEKRWQKAKRTYKIVNEKKKLEKVFFV